ncbi:hypothetical protein BLSTO_03606 [Blastocystis sp. subtype 1]
MEESELFKTIGEDYSRLFPIIDKEEFEEAATIVITMNTSLKSILRVYRENHSGDSQTMTINLDNCALLRQLIVLNALYVIGPTLFESEEKVPWGAFSSVLKVEERILKKGYPKIASFLSNDAMEAIVITTLSTGFIDDFEIAGVIYSLSYFIGFILKAKSLHLPFSSSIRFFFSHLSSFSHVLLVTCILSLQQSTLAREKWLGPGVSELMSLLIMQGALAGVIATYLSYTDKGDLNAIVCVARGIASCSKHVAYDEYMQSLGSQLAAILQEKGSNPYVVTVCVHVLDLLLLKDSNAVFSILFPTLFAPLLFVTKQPFFSSISLQPSSFPSIPTPPDLLTRVVRCAARLLQVGSTIPHVVDAVSVLIPSLFHLYVFCLASKNALLSTLNKLIKLFIRSSPTAVSVFLSIIQHHDTEPRPVRFALDADGAVILRAASNTPEDTEWSFATAAEVPSTREHDAILSCWVINGSFTWLSELFVALLDFFFTSNTPSPATTAVASLLLQIMSMNIPSLFGDHLLGGLQSLEHILRILLKQTCTDAVGASEDFKQSVVALVEGILSTISQQAISIPKVREISVKREKSRQNVTKKEEEEEKEAYWNALKEETGVLLHLVAKLQEAEANPLFLSMQSSLLAMQRRLENVVAPSEEEESTLALGEAIEQATRDLRSPYEATRSLALSQLEKIIQTKSKEELDPCLQPLLNTLKQGALDPESYVYLSAINGMMILGAAYSERVLPLLLELFNNALAPLDLRLRVCEAIVCCVRFMQDASVKFGDRVMNAFLSFLEVRSSLSWTTVEKKKEVKATAENEVFAVQALRASCLSALAELVTYLGYAITPFVPQLLSQCRGVLLFEKGDDAVIVRRAAVFLLYRLLCGVEGDAHSMLDGQEDTVRHILEQACDDKDAIVEGHARTALALFHSLEKTPGIQEL